MAHSLRESEREVERQENVRRQFMMDVAHEMRTPIDNHEWIARWLEIQYGARVSSWPFAGTDF